MLYIVYTFIAAMTGGILLALVSDAFAYEISRLLEATLDAVEYRRALMAKRRGVEASRVQHGGAAQGFGVAYRRRAEISL